MSGFYDFRDSIEYVVNQYFERKRGANSNNSDNQVAKNGKQLQAALEDLPASPFRILKNRNGLAYKFIYGDFKALETDPYANVIVWQEELIRDENGVILAFEKTYPDGSVERETLVKENGQVTGTVMS